MTEELEKNIEETAEDLLIIEDFEPEEKVMRVVPLRGMVIYPNTESHLDLGRKFSVHAVQECMRANEALLLAFQKNADAGLPSAENLYEIGVVAKVRRTINLPTEGMRVLVTGLYPVRVLEYHIDENEITATFEEIPEIEYDRDALEVKARAVRHQFEQYAKRSIRIGTEQLTTILDMEPLPLQLNMMCGYLNVSLEERYALLAEQDVEARIDMMLELMIRESSFADMEKELNEKVKAQVDKSQKEYYLREKMRVISDELGEGKTNQKKCMHSKKNWQHWMWMMTFVPELKKASIS
ncbi:MAG: LON peptidase substrate-binding domain-containing protein [Peptococcaceae bacterium]|nr:LON peptidase substrate-binding domain-containing protein [Peptococcaceae bacterium]